MAFFLGSTFDGIAASAIKTSLITLTLFVAITETDYALLLTSDGRLTSEVIPIFHGRQRTEIVTNI